MEIKNVKLSEVKSNPNNPRIIKDDKFTKLVKSIKEFPKMLEIRPIVVNADMIVLGGNMRLKACKEAGLKEVPVIFAQDLTEEEQKQFIIKDNVGFGEWDWDMIANEWDAAEIQEWGLDIPDFGVTEIPAAEEDDYEMPEELHTDIVLGDLFEIGEHRLLCGDSTDSDAVAKLMNGEKADMVLTDPPYNVNYGGNNNPAWKQGDRSIKNDHMDGDSFRDFIQAVVSNIKLFCDGVVYCFGAQGVDGRIMFSVLDQNLHNSGTIIWLKDRLVLGRSKYHNKYEPCWFGWNKSGDTFTDDRSLTNVFECKRPSKSDLHPTMKPIELLEMPLNHNPKAKSVLDLFLGSGSTMVAAHQLKRKCYGIELDPKYCQVIVDRMKKLDPSLVILKNGIAL
jgi:DNA modification methylase